MPTPKPPRRPSKSPYGSSPYSSPYGTTPHNPSPYAPSQGAPSPYGPSVSGPSPYSKSSNGGRQAKGPTRPTTQALNVLVLLASLLLGFLFWVVTESCWNSLLENWAAPVRIGFLFSIMALLVSLLVLGLSALTGSLKDNVVFRGQGMGSAFLFSLLLCIVIFGAGALFQWIYSVDFVAGARKPTSLVFVIDDSGSMSITNDPLNLRYDAIDDVLDEEDDSFPYMVYSFGRDVVLLRDMAPARTPGMESADVGSGETNIHAALTQVIEDYEDGLWEGGRVPRVILLTDGDASDIYSTSQVDPLLRRYLRAGISISTVGLGDADLGLLAHIAEGTGGSFLTIDAADELSQALNSASFSMSRRDLLSPRPGGRLPALYAILRILFLTVLGFLVGVCAFISCGQSDSLKITLVTSAVAAFLGALAMELCLLFRLDEQLARLILWMLVALTISSKSVFRRPSRVTG